MSEEARGAPRCSAESRATARPPPPSLRKPPAEHPRSRTAAARDDCPRRIFDPSTETCGAPFTAHGAGPSKAYIATHPRGRVRTGEMLRVAAHTRVFTTRLGPTQRTSLCRGTVLCRCVAPQPVAARSARRWRWPLWLAGERTHHPPRVSCGLVRAGVAAVWPVVRWERAEECRLVVLLWRVARPAFERQFFPTEPFLGNRSKNRALRSGCRPHRRTAHVGRTQRDLFVPPIRLWRREMRVLVPKYTQKQCTRTRR